MNGCKIKLKLYCSIVFYMETDDLIHAICWLYQTKIWQTWSNRLYGIESVIFYFWKTWPTFSNKMEIKKFVSVSNWNKTRCNQFLAFQISIFHLTLIFHSNCEKKAKAIGLKFCNIKFLIHNTDLFWKFGGDWIYRSEIIIFRPILVLKNSYKNNPFPFKSWGSN